MRLTKDVAGMFCSRWTGLMALLGGVTFGLSACSAKTPLHATSSLPAAPTPVPATATETPTPTATFPVVMCYAPPILMTPTVTPTPTWIPGDGTRMCYAPPQIMLGTPTPSPTQVSSTHLNHRRMSLADQLFHEGWVDDRTHGRLLALAGNVG